MGKKAFYNILVSAIIVFTCLANPDANSQTRNPKPARSAVHAVSSKSETVAKSSPKPEQPKWYSGEIYTHHNCNEEASFSRLTDKNHPDVITILTKSKSNKEISAVKKQEAVKEMAAGKIIQCDTEWQYKPEGLGLTDLNMEGSLALLGLKEALPNNEVLPYKTLEQAKAQKAVTGFVLLKYFNDSIGNKSNCCFPLDYSIETALGTVDFISQNSLRNDAVIRSYYKLLNCGFRIGLAASTDFPCKSDSQDNNLTYVQLKDQPLTYEKWIEGIKSGRTVISMDGHKEFLDIKANGSSTPGDEIKVKGQADVNVMVRWTSGKEFAGKIELLCNGKVVATQAGTARPGSSVFLMATQKFIRSGWLAARRVDEKGCVSHTAPIYVTVDDQPIRASVGDAKYFISRIDHILDNISYASGKNKNFSNDNAVLKARYEKARDIYIRIQDETLDQLKKMGDGILDNGSVVKTPVKKPVRHKSKYPRKR